MTDLDLPAVVTAPEARGRALLRLSRPQQWHKAAMLFAVHAAAGALDSPIVVLRAPNGQPAILITLFIPSEGAASGESGELIYYQTY